LKTEPSYELRQGRNALVVSCSAVERSTHELAIFDKAAFGLFLMFGASPDEIMECLVCFINLSASPFTLSPRGAAAVLAASVVQTAPRPRSFQLL